jgi:hypothetical protein
MLYGRMRARWECTRWGFQGAGKGLDGMERVDAWVPSALTPCAWHPDMFMFSKESKPPPPAIRAPIVTLCEPLIKYCARSRNSASHSPGSHAYWCPLNGILKCRSPQQLTKTPLWVWVSVTPRPVSVLKVLRYRAAARLSRSERTRSV